MQTPEQQRTRPPRKHLQASKQARKTINLSEFSRFGHENSERFPAPPAPRSRRPLGRFGDARPATLRAGTMALAAARPSHVAFTHPDVSEFFPAKRPGPSSWKTASRLYRLNLLTLFSDHHSPMAMPDAKQRFTRPARMSRLAASPLTDISQSNPSAPETPLIAQSRTRISPATSYSIIKLSESSV